MPKLNPEPESTLLISGQEFIPMYGVYNAGVDY